MISAQFIPALGLVGAVIPTAFGAYTLNIKYDATGPTKFFDHFDFWDMKDRGNDPTNGSVWYANRADAMNGSPKIAYYENDQIYLGVDSVNTINDDEKGRRSIRVYSKELFDNGLFIGDFAHLPGGVCGIWPAFWVIHDNPEGHTGPSEYGEVDIYEQHNKATHNEVTLHTGQKCYIQSQTLDKSDCYDPEGNSGGCSVAAPPHTFGNDVKDGGVWAMLLNSNVTIWYFKQGSVPSDIMNFQPNPGPAWGTPVMTRQPMASSDRTGKTPCDMKAGFHAMNITLNIDLCGDDPLDDWDTEDDNGVSCAASTRMSCAEYVAKTPTAFSEAYFKINYIAHYKES